MSNTNLAIVAKQRWTAKRKASLVMDIMKGKTTLAEASREHDLTPSEIQDWTEDAQKGMENALRAKPKDIHEQYQGKIKNLHAKVGELVLENDILKKLEALQRSQDEM